MTLPQVVGDAVGFPSWFVGVVLMLQAVAFLAWALKPIVYAVAARIQARTLLRHQQVFVALHAAWPEATPQQLARAMTELNRSMAPVNWWLTASRLPPDKSTIIRPVHGPTSAVAAKANCERPAPVEASLADILPAELTPHGAQPVVSEPH